MKTTVQLSQAEGHYYSDRVERAWVNIIKAKGFQFLNTFAGIGLVTPERVLDENGLETQNPIVRREHGSIQWVRVRKQAIGRVESGTLRSIDLTLTYDVKGYLASTLFDAYMDRKQPKWGEIVNGPTAEKESRGSRTKAVAHISGGNCLLYDTSDLWVMDFLREHTSHAITADRTADTIVERNLMRRWFGFDTCSPDGTVEIGIWEHGPGSDKYKGDIDFQNVPEAHASDSDQVEADSNDVKLADDAPVYLPQEKPPASSGSLRTLVRTVGVEKSKEALSGFLKREKMSWGDLGGLHDEKLLDEIRDILMGAS